jgi:hypothetical protein
MFRNVVEMESPYSEALTGILSFSSFAETEQTLARLENLCREYEAASDKKGVEYCRRIASMGRRRAESISRDKRVWLPKRLQKQEVALWFRIWLETPAIFCDWLSMRKTTDEFKELLASERLIRPKLGDRSARTQIP